MNNSILKNIQELSETLVDDFYVNNYYELNDLLYELWNFRAKLYKKDQKLYTEIVNELMKGE
jgi:hypothetical protein